MKSNNQPKWREVLADSLSNGVADAIFEGFSNLDQVIASLNQVVKAGIANATDKEILQNAVDYLLEHGEGLSDAVKESADGILEALFNLLDGV